MPSEGYGLFDGIAGRAGDVGDDDAVEACKRVEQARFSGVWCAKNRGLHTVFDEVSAAAGGKKRVELPGSGLQGIYVGLQAEGLDILVGIVQNGVEMRADVHETVVDGVQLFAQNARNLTGRVGGGVGGFRVNEVDDGLGLREVHLAV